MNTAIILGVAEGILGSNSRTLLDTLDPGNALKLQNYWESQIKTTKCLIFSEIAKCSLVKVSHYMVCDMDSK